MTSSTGTAAAFSRCAATSPASTAAEYGMAMSYLVTGGAGFIGRQLCLELLAHGNDVRVVDSLVPQVHGDGEAGAAGRGVLRRRSPQRRSARPCPRRRRRRVPSRGRGRRRAEHVRDRPLRRRQRPRNRGAAGTACPPTGVPARRRLVDERLWRGPLHRRERRAAPAPCQTPRRTRGPRLGSRGPGRRAADAGADGRDEAGRTWPRSTR